MAKKNLLADGLELSKEVTVSGVNYTDMGFLRHNEFFVGQNASKKFNEEREPAVQAGLAAVKDLGIELPEEFLLLSKWWENKDARNEIKQMLDNYANEQGIDPVTFMQENIRQTVEQLAAIKEAVNRMLYITTYFKPREGSGATMMPIIIDGRTYTVSKTAFAALREQYADDRATLKAEVLKIAKLKDNNIIEEL